MGDTGTTMSVLLPDWSGLDTIRHSPLPFALWPVGDQPLLGHWLDLAVNQGATRVRFHALDRPAAIRAHLEEARLWPLEKEVVTTAPTPGITVHNGAYPAWLDNPPPAPTDGWQLLNFWSRLNEAWLDWRHRSLGPSADWLAVGRHALLHPTTVIRQPVWIGDEVYAGPGCQLGPYAVIENGCCLEGHSSVQRSFMVAHTYLGPHAELDQGILEGARLFNLRHEAVVDCLDNLLAGSTRPDAPVRTPWGERWQARLIEWRLARHPRRPLGTALVTHDGLALPVEQSDHWLLRRRPWLKLVRQGRLRLFGVLPRPAADWAALSEEWRSILKSAPCGFFSYADALGVHEPGEAIEPLHAVFQTVQNSPALQAQQRLALRDALRSLGRTCGP